MSSQGEVAQAWDALVARIETLLRNHKKRNYKLSKITTEQKLIIFVDRETQQVLAKLSIDTRYKKVLEKDEKMVDFFSQDAKIEDIVKQIDCFKTLETALLSYRNAERGNAVYNRLN